MIKVTTKIQLWTSLIIVLVTLVSDIVAFTYFSGIMVRQEYESERDKIRLLSNQLTYIMEDIEKFALSIAIDEDVQDYLQGKQDSSVTLQKQLGVWEVQRDYIFNMVIHKDDEIILSDPVMISGISRELYKSLMSHTLSYDDETKQTLTFLPEISDIRRLNEEHRLISCVVNIYHMSKYKMKLGQLIINLNYDKIIELIQKNADTAGFEQLFWVSAENELYFVKDNDDTKQEMTDRIMEQLENSSSEAFALDRRYVVVGKEKISGWKFISITDLLTIYGRISYILLFFVIMGVFSVFAGWITINRICSKIMQPISVLEKHMQKVTLDSMEYEPVLIETGDEFEILARGYNSMMERISSYVESSMLYEREKKETEMELLLAQINPHFIYNTLNTIIYLSANKDYEAITSVTRSFITLLQDSIKINSRGMLVLIRDEAEVVRGYLELQRNRYRDRFDVDIEVDESAMDRQILRAVLQPLVENSLIHGIFPKGEKGHLQIRILDGQSHLTCVVEDNGCGMSREQIRDIENGMIREKQRGVYSIGLNNIRKRLELVYGTDYEFHISSEPGRFCRIELKIPIKE